MPKRFRQMFIALDFYLDRSKEVVVVGPKLSKDKDESFKCCVMNYTQKNPWAILLQTQNHPFRGSKTKPLRWTRLFTSVKIISVISH
ncbi:MAG: hypothetical protein Ct9H300mP23_10020 [Nitrospinota bacterium]|nr:MAG: hypothetical protein Ct9H300mP23_10020 [Nitrospinota bacterium]